MILFCFISIPILRINYYYSFGDIIDNNRVLLGNGKEKEAEGVYNALISMIDSERFQEIIGSVSGYE